MICPWYQSQQSEDTSTLSPLSIGPVCHFVESFKVLERGLQDSVLCSLLSYLLGYVESISKHTLVLVRAVWGQASNECSVKQSLA